MGNETNGINHFQKEALILEMSNLQEDIFSKNMGVGLGELSIHCLLAFGKMSTLKLFFEHIEGTSYHVTHAKDLIQELKHEIENHKEFKQRPEL